MEKRTKSLSSTIAPVKLYIDDVEALVEALVEAGEAEVEITTEDHVLRTVHELERYGGGGSISGVEIKRHRPLISVDLRPGGARIYASDDDAAATGVYEKARKIVRARRRWFWWLVAERWWVWISIITLGTVGSSLLGLAGRTPSFLPLGLVCLIAAAAWFGLSFYFSLYRGAVLVPLRRQDAPGFFRRNADTLVVAAFSAVLGAAVTYALTQL
jgi:hypothetical protein